MCLSERKAFSRSPVNDGKKAWRSKARDIWKIFQFSNQSRKVINQSKWGSEKQNMPCRYQSMYLSCFLTYPDYPPWKWFLPTLIRVPGSQDSQEGIHVSSFFLCSTSHLERIHYHEEGQRWDKDCPWNCHEDGLGVKWRPHQDHTDHTCSWILPDLTRSFRIFLDLTVLTGFQLLKDLKERRSPIEKTAIHDMT